MKENKTFKFTKMYKYATAFAVTFCVVAGITISNNHKSQIKTIVTNEKENITHENINTVQNDVTNFTEEKIETDNEIIIENYTDNSKGPNELILEKEICYETPEATTDRYDSINPIEVSDDGRLFFTLKDENIDITDLISTKTSFTYEYIEDDIKHLVIVGLNSEDANDYGYAEYLNDGNKYFSMLSSNVDFDEFGSPKQQWLINTINKFNISYKK